MSWASLRLKDFAKFRLWMGLTILCALGFMGIKAIEYSTKFAHHLYPETSNFLGIYFTLTGLHGLHVVGGRPSSQHIARPCKRQRGGRS